MNELLRDIELTVNDIAIYAEPLEKLVRVRGAMEALAECAAVPLLPCSSPPSLASFLPSSEH